MRPAAPIPANSDRLTILQSGYGWSSFAEIVAASSTWLGTMKEGARLARMTVTVAVFGAICLGISIGWIVRFFLERFSEYNSKILASTVSVLSGGGLLAILKVLTQDKEPQHWLVDAMFCYPIGLALGLIVLYPWTLKWDASARNSIASDLQWAKIWAKKRDEQYGPDIARERQE
jgi:hypothetical protein